MSSPLHQRVLQNAAHEGLNLWDRSGIPAHPQIALGVAAGVLAVAGIATWTALRRRPTAEELERRRREALATNGRLIDGVILDARTLDGDDAYGPAPEVLLYTYRLSGVVYQCAQDVSSLAERINGVRIDQPVQVRYDPRYPGNSIIASETWSGLRH